MPNAYHHDEDKGLTRPKLRMGNPPFNVANQTWKIPKTPTKARRVHKVVGRAVKVYRQGDIIGA